jgi:two-component system response regulator CpxR
LRKGLPKKVCWKSPELTWWKLNNQDNSQDPIKVLIADDDRVLGGMLKEYLESEHCDVQLADNGQEALGKLEQGSFDLLVLDIMMPVMTGIDALKTLRKHSNLPVIMLTARGDDLDRILGLELGADDYIAKPCNPRELYARIRAVLRRTRLPMEPGLEVIQVDDIKLEPASRSVTTGCGSPFEAAVSLTQTEFDLLHLLLLTPGNLVTKSDMSSKVLGKPLSQWDRSIDVHVSNLRKKLGAYPKGADRIKTLRGSGYIYHMRPGGG